MGQLNRQSCGVFMHGPPCGVFMHGPRRDAPAARDLTSTGQCWTPVGHRDEGASTDAMIAHIRLTLEGIAIFGATSSTTVGALRRNYSAAE